MTSNAHHVPSVGIPFEKIIIPSFVILLTINGFFVTRSLDSLDSVNKNTINNTIKIAVLESKISVKVLESATK